MAFAYVLDEAGAFLSSEEVIAYFEKPWKWLPEFKRWEELGSPSQLRALYPQTPQESSWIKFVDFIMGIADDEEDD